MVEFRFWDNVRNKMYYDGDYWLPDRYIDPCANNCYPIKVTNHGIVYCKKLTKNQNYIEVYKDGKKECYYDNWEHDELSADRVSFGMGVEIVDNNGVEIYTGDLVHSWGGECYQGVWEYDVVIEVKMCGACLLELENSENLEIIGNIYEGVGK